MTILDRPDFDPERNLDEGPYRRKGFTPELQQRIQESIERKARKRRSALPLIACAAAAAAGLAIMMSLQFGPAAMRSLPLAASASASAPQQAAAKLDSAAAMPVPAYNSGLLLGLRTDFERNAPRAAANSADSSYRTLFVAPLNGQLDVAAEGKGILLPYGQTFWKIDSVSQSAGSSYYSTLLAHPANKALPELAPLRADKQQLQHSEKLLYVGNKYVSLEQTETTARGQKTVRSKRVWVKEVKQVNGLMTLPTTDPSQRNYVRFRDLFGAAADSSDEWAIVRKPGMWTPALAAISVEGDKESYTLAPVAEALPDAVVSHDRLCCTWADIKRVQPDAVDALSSPEQDFVTIITPSTIYFYEDRSGKIGDSPQLSINLNENESLVMAQWATGDYVDEWVKASRNYLSVADTARPAARR
jgi:hypothetical protein